MAKKNLGSLAARKGRRSGLHRKRRNGFSNAVARQVSTKLDAIAKKRPTVRMKTKSAVYVEPVIAAKIEYRAWTADGKLRPPFKGLRDVADEITI
ncbi:ATP dependent DNA ligase [Pararhizobium qamdonense]|uniref:ATP dependent DNA ligase n=1 Tax=Pararhizobium qamdonense TaxID=3031126 RepID=UPI0038B28A1D